MNDLTDKIFVYIRFYWGLCKISIIFGKMCLYQPNFLSSSTSFMFAKQRTFHKKIKISIIHGSYIWNHVFHRLLERLSRYYSELIPNSVLLRGITPSGAGCTIIGSGNWNWVTLMQDKCLISCIISSTFYIPQHIICVYYIIVCIYTFIFKTKSDNLPCLF